MKIEKQQGASTLLLVLIVMMVLTLIAFSLQLFTFLQSKVAAQSIHVQQSFFGAESSLYETLQHMRNDPNWPDIDDLPVTDFYNVGDTKITRVIDFGEDGNLSIEISANTKGTKRRLEASIARGVEKAPPADIVLVIDRSGSMQETGGNYPLRDAKNAVVDFISLIEGSGLLAEISLVSYSSEASLDQELTDNFSNVERFVNSDPSDGYELQAGGRTNIASAVREATLELNANSRSEAEKIIVILSDGIANVANGCGSCGSWPCTTTCCTQAAVSEAVSAQELGYTVYSVFLSNIYSSDGSCTIAQTEDLGRQTLISIASSEDNYFETEDSSELSQIYQSIAGEITSGFFEYQEGIPIPD